MGDDPRVFVVDDDKSVRDSLVLLLESADLAVEPYPSAQAFLEAYAPDRRGCLLLDVRMSGMNGLELQGILSRRGLDIPIIFMSAHGDVPMSARAFKAGAVDFLEKPLNEEALLRRVREALERDAQKRQRRTEELAARMRLQRLTPREREVMVLVVQGCSNKDIAKRLRVSHRTVETHRARVMAKMEARSLPALIRMAMACGLHEAR